MRPRVANHLAILAVRPDRQGQGTGTALLHAHHAILDTEGIVAYLEASDERTRGIYLRHGYADYGNPITLVGGPSMYPMVRHPAPLAITLGPDARARAMSARETAGPALPGPAR